MEEIDKLSLPSEGREFRTEEPLKGYRQRVWDGLRAGYARTVLSEKDLDNLEWAKNYLANYERKYKIVPVKR